MSRPLHPRNKLALSRRELLALAVTGGAWSWAQPAPCWAIGEDAREREEPARSGRIVAMVAGFAKTPQNPDGISGFVVIDPENGAWKRICDNAGGGSLSPDGKILTFNAPQPRGAFQAGVWTCDIDGAGPPKRITDIPGYPVWSPDGKQIIFCASQGDRSLRKYETWRMNADGSNQGKLPLNASDQVLDWSSDGQWLALVVGHRPVEKMTVHLIHPDGTGRKPMTEDEGINILPRFSPDSRRLLYAKRTIEGDVRKSALWVVDLDGGNRRQIPLELEPNTAVVARWSPDGARLALQLSTLRAEVPVDDNQLEICDNDGKNRRKLPLPTGKFILQDWR